MKRLLRIFALLMAASMLVWLAGCGGDDDDDDEVVPANFVSATSGGAALAGSSVAGNATIVVTLDKTVTAGEVTVDVPGTTAVSGATLTWTPTGNMPAGSHTLSAVTADGESVTITPITFTATEPDANPPELDAANCDPSPGETGVDPADYPESIVVAAKDDKAMSSIKVTSVDPVFDFTEEYADGKMTLKFMKYTMPNETEYTIEYTATDAAGNTADLSVTFTTMSKEE